MTRRSGQITAPQALAGILVITLAAIALVRVMAVLLPPEDAETLALAEEAVDDARGTALVESQPGVRSCPPAGAVGDEVSSTLLYECPALFDRRAVTYTGEVVGAVLRRDGYAWVQLNDDPYGLALGPLATHGVAAGANSGVGVRIPLEAADRIEHVGRHQRLGDRLTVRGVFLRSDPLDSGAAVIVADTVLRIQPGEVRPAATFPGRRRAAVALLIVTLGVAGLAFRDSLAVLFPRLHRRWTRVTRG